MEIALKYKVKRSKNGKFPSNYKASPIDFKTQISLRTIQLTINLILPISTFYIFFLSTFLPTLRICDADFLENLGIFKISFNSWALFQSSVNTLVKLVKFTRVTGLPSGKISFVKISFCKVSFFKQGSVMEFTDLT